MLKPDSRTIRIALAQINVSVGDLDGNRTRIMESIKRARELGAALVAFPELAITGYPPEDLLFKPRFIEANIRTLHQLVKETQNIAAVIGFADRKDDIYNSAAVACDGNLIDVYHKSFLPNYGVFDEDRYFRPGERVGVYTLNGVTFGVNICEDIWYPGGPAHIQALSGNAELIVNISSSPFHDGKGLQREQMIATRASDYGSALAFCNLVGGQDELVFDGGSFVMDQEGGILASSPRFEEDLLVVDIDVESVFRHRLHDPRRRKEDLGSSVYRIDLPPVDDPRDSLPCKGASQPDHSDSRLKNIYDGLVLGTRDYVKKNGFEKVLVALSGGIDSALVSVIASDALGPENVICVTMPSSYSSEDTRNDAVVMADNLGVRLITLPIQGIFDTYLAELSDEFEGRPKDIAEENIQPRIRGNLLMALCNKFGWIVLTTGNKSEMSMGYATLYGDMAGGFAVIKDIYKTLVYDLVHYRNDLSDKSVIPQSTVQRPPTAELREDQLDTDSLPAYPILDPILEAYVEEDRSLWEIVSMGFEKELVLKVIQNVDRNEYKRRQSPPGIKITTRAFGRDRRLPITNQCREY
ncbi:MAG: NAD+ synthase [Gemmatimonadetes bacterium]|nr:NAD+ synthase [Gemmatimonadota bacterium]